MKKPRYILLKFENDYEIDDLKHVLKDRKGVTYLGEPEAIEIQGAWIKVKGLKNKITL